ncbi:sigma factor-like helix-turn-helix DNA-binding protein [Nonomuraea sp. NPDC049269]|uniref:RNA polymerase sigma factor n=1 Tax=Nonomuraea sp. NPDC049269 TaxID=3364349 RepID=UPI0037248ED8
MNDRALVESLRARAPGALAALYDAYAEGIHRYCWSLLLSSDGAQVALRDTMIAAEAHAGSLADPGRLRPWLYALARAECLRRRMAEPPGADEALAQAPPLDDAADADLRIMAWNAIQSLRPGDREVLELSAAHELSTPELAAVLGTAARHVEAAHEEARERLRDAITAEILARKGPYDCPRRAGILTGFSGELTAEMRAQLIGHLPRCLTCSPHRTRQVSAAKVFELLPRVPLPDSLGVRVMSCFADPELLPYRRYVARRSGALDAAGFPVATARHSRKWPQALAGAMAAVATVVAIVVIFQQFGRVDGGVPGIASAAFPAPGEPPAIRLPWHSAPRDVPIIVEPILDSTVTVPLGTLTPTTPATGPTSPARSTPETREATETAKDQTKPQLTGTPTPDHQSAEPAQEPDKHPDTRPERQPDKRPGDHPDKGHHPGRTPCPTDTPTPAAPPTQTPVATPIATPTVAPAQTPTAPAVVPAG